MYFLHILIKRKLGDLVVRYCTWAFRVNGFSSRYCILCILLKHLVRYLKS